MYSVMAIVKLPPPPRPMCRSTIYCHSKNIIIINLYFFFILCNYCYAKLVLNSRDGVIIIISHLDSHKIYTTGNASTANVPDVAYTPASSPTVCPVALFLLVLRLLLRSTLLMLILQLLVLSTLFLPVLRLLVLLISVPAHSPTTGSVNSVPARFSTVGSVDFCSCSFSNHWFCQLCSCPFFDCWFC